MAEPTTCPIAELGRQAVALDKTFVACEEVQFTLKAGPERLRLERLGEHIDDHRLALERAAAGMQAQSVQGAMFQVLVAYSEAHLLSSMAGSKQTSDAEQTMRRIAGLLYSAVRVLERESGTPAAELGAGFYMHARYDPHPALKASLAGEPIPPAPDDDADE